MVNDGFRALHQAGILRRRVLDDVEAMRRLNAGNATVDDAERLAREGRWLDGGFYLGSRDLYDWLRGLPADQRDGLGMTRISHINELYGGNETLERLQRRDARFFNTCMMGTLLGDAVSDALEDGRVVSGVGGQYNFVAMAHALRDGRSVLLFRATREAHGESRSSVLWNYGHVTIPRHLRDVMVTEYGIADLRGASMRSMHSLSLAPRCAPSAPMAPCRTIRWAAISPLSNSAWSRRSAGSSAKPRIPSESCGPSQRPCYRGRRPMPKPCSAWTWPRPPPCATVLKRACSASPCSARPRGRSRPTDAMPSPGRREWS